MSRGQYGRQAQHVTPLYEARGIYRRALVGAGGSILPHTPSEIEDEMDQLHTEIMQFADEALAWQGHMDEAIKAQPDYKLLADAVKREYAAVEALPPKGRQMAIARARKLQDQTADLFNQRRAQASTWFKATWTPFFEGWKTFRSEKKDIPFQMWPGSGVWDRVQDYRERFIKTRDTAPFKKTGPEPTRGEDRKDPSLSGGIGDLFSIAKWGLIGLLGIGGAVAVSSLVSNVRKGRDPVEQYASAYRKFRR